jgi:hypothetical protein
MLVCLFRAGQKPDGVCCVVGSLAYGFPEELNQSSDLIYSHTDILGSPDQPDSNLQFFWEAFPTGAGPTHRTTYMFCYMDAGVICATLGYKRRICTLHSYTIKHAQSLKGSSRSHICLLHLE